MKAHVYSAGRGGKMSFWNNVNGSIPYPLTNDYLVKVILQRRGNVLRSLLCSILELKEEQIHTIRLLNTIIPGERIDEKQFILDVQLLLNNNISINIEMQVLNYKDWPERSLQYLCRNFDILNKGEIYINSKTAIHIGILDFKLFEDSDEYYTSNRLMSVTSHKIYTDKFQLYTLSLPLVDQATEKDRIFHRDMWGKYFKIQTWEELHKMAHDYPEIEEAAEEIYNCISDLNIRAQIEARQDYERRQRTIVFQINHLENLVSQKDDQLAQKDDQLAQKDAEIARLQKLLGNQ